MLGYSLKHVTAILVDGSACQSVGQLVFQICQQTGTYLNQTTGLDFTPFEITVTYSSSEKDKDAIICTPYSRTNSFQRCFKECEAGFDVCAPSLSFHVFHSPLLIACSLLTNTHLILHPSLQAASAVPVFLRCDCGQVFHMLILQFIVFIAISCSRQVFCI